jgi:hypothetical protein
MLNHYHHNPMNGHKKLAPVVGVEVEDQVGVVAAGQVEEVEVEVEVVSQNTHHKIHPYPNQLLHQTSLLGHHLNQMQHQRYLLITEQLKSFQEHH